MNYLSHSKNNRGLGGNVDITNPFAQIRIRLLQLSLAKMSGFLEVSPPALHYAEVGATKNPRAVLKGLERIGFDRELLEEKYQKWRLRFFGSEPKERRAMLELERMNKTNCFPPIDVIIERMGKATKEEAIHE